MAFHGRRQSRDRAVCARILEDAAGRRLWMSRDTLRLFEAPYPEYLTAAEDFLAQAGPGELCFVEEPPLLPWLDRLEGLVLYRWNDFFDVTNTNHHTPDILYKRHLFRVGNAEGLPLRHISVKIIEDSFVVFRILYPHGIEFQNWFPFWAVVNLIGTLPCFNIFPHEPCKGMGRKTISGVADLREKMTVSGPVAFLIGMNRCLYHLSG